MIKSLLWCHLFTEHRRRRRFRIGTRQRSWTRLVAWELIPMTALWAGKGGAQLSQYTAQVGQKPTGSVYLQSWPQGLLLRRTRRFFPSDGRDHRQYSFYHPTKGRKLSRPSWLAPYCRQSPIQVLTGPGVELRSIRNALPTILFPRFCANIHCVSRINILDIFDLKKDYQIWLILDMNNFWQDLPSNDRLIFHLAQSLLLH